MPRVQEEPIAQRPGQVGWVKAQKLFVENVDEIGTAHGSARMTGSGFFDHGRR